MYFDLLGILKDLLPIMSRVTTDTGNPFFSKISAMSLSESLHNSYETILSKPSDAKRCSIIFVTSFNDALSTN